MEISPTIRPAVATPQSTAPSIDKGALQSYVTQQLNAKLQPFAASGRLCMPGLDLSLKGDVQMGQQLVHLHVLSDGPYGWDTLPGGKPAASQSPQYIGVSAFYDAAQADNNTTQVHGVPNTSGELDFHIDAPTNVKFANNIDLSPDRPGENAAH